MSWYPKIRRREAGHYVVECGEDMVVIVRRLKSWRAEYFQNRSACIEMENFPTKAKAVEWANSQLAELA